ISAWWKLSWVLGSSSGGGAPHKYFGKWPFRRVLGAQELASVLLSLANLAAHLHCLARLTRHCRTLRAEGQHKAQVVGEGVVGPPYPYLWLWRGYGLLHANAWVCSAVFHCRDTWATERLDYCSADAVVAASLAAACIRAGGLSRPRQAAPVLAAVGVALLAHLRYMLLIKFDYGWNVKVCVAAGVATALVWLLWSWASAHPARGLLLTFLLAAHAALLLELLDFPPLLALGASQGDAKLGLLDAHALWHATTVPLTYLFYAFLRRDATFLATPAAQAGSMRSSVKRD
ncbi:hypothetical protein QJQ45_015828, partial [Haematococcus lacustris]